MSRRGDFEPLAGEDTFYRVQAICQGRTQVTGQRQRTRPDFPLKGVVRVGHGQPRHRFGERQARAEGHAVLRDFRPRAPSRCRQGTLDTDIC